MIPRPAQRFAAQPGPLLKSVSRSFYLSLRFLPEPIRGPLALGYLLARTSDTLADSHARPAEERLEALSVFEQAIQNESPFSIHTRFPLFQVSHAGERELLQYSEALLEAFLSQPDDIRQELRRVMHTIIGGQRNDLTRFQSASAACPRTLENAAELEDYTYAVAGCVGEFWTRICAIQLPEFALSPLTTLLEQARHFGQGLQLVNILRDIPEDLRAGRCYLPADELSNLGITPDTLLFSGNTARPIFRAWLNKAERWLLEGALYEQSIQGVALKFSVCLPRLLGFKTLNALKETPPLETPVRVKINRATVLKSVVRSFGGALASSPPCY